MLSLLFLIPVALLLAIVAMGFFLWAVKDGQYDDLDRDGSELLFDDEKNGLSKGAGEGEGKGEENDP